METFINKEETIRALVTTGLLEDIPPQTLARFIKRIDEINELMTESNGHCHQGKEK